ncbi:MAG: sulfatase-like hydrolase/transferase, partial [Verrucomicrobiae bacterium]|nr:sulfatase-like hydrolase/transferase [Verrucomicrobiae bacterium]
MNRRDFLTTTSLAAAASVTSSAFGQRQSRDERPNILVIMTDQQSANMMSIAGNANLHTPAMDSLARKGVRFTKAYCTNPICVPSRTSFLTGTPSHVNGINFNRNDAPNGINGTPLTKVVQQAGYRTGYVGKWHIPHSIQDSDWNGIDFVKYPKSNEVDFLIPDGCSEFLAQKSDKPFLLFASFVNPHDICETARILSGIDDRFKNGLIPPFPDVSYCPKLPSNHAIPDDEPEVIRIHQAIPTNSRTYPSINWDDETWRIYRWAYARLVELVDFQIGKVLELLNVYGVEENTVILFTSDHGDGNGAHCWNQKTLLYEETAGIPFMITDLRNPRDSEVNRERLVSMGLDLFPTIFDYAGISSPAGLMGLSARPETIRSGPAHDYIVAENDLHPEYGRSGGVYGRMIRTANFKYVCYSEGKHHEQLFDLENDPGEMNNLVG